MKLNFFTMKQQTQEFVLRLFIESFGDDSSYYSSYSSSARCGTYARLHS